MRIRSLGLLAEILSVPAVLLVLTGCGTTPNNNTTCNACTFLYATTNANQILSFKLDSSGTLGTPASTVTSGTADSPAILGVGFVPQPPSPVYASDPKVNAIDAFAMNINNGTLKPLRGSPFSVGGSPGTPAGLLIFGNYLYSGNTNGTVAAFNITSGGGLTPVPGSPFAAGVAPLHLLSTYTNSPSIPLLYAADFTNGGIWAFTISSNGALKSVPGSPFATPANSAPTAMFAGGNAITGGILYLALSGLNEIAAFSINGAGALAALPGSPFATGRRPVSLLGFGRVLYVLNSLDHSISAFSMDPNTGNLVAVQGSPFPAGTATEGLVNRSNIVYVPDRQSNSILTFVADNTTGALTPLSGSPFTTGVGPVALTTVGFPEVDPP
jgi:6-phosphogluconolactonase (cycloisomerase 2 family)